MSRLVHDQRGITVVEAMVAALLFVLGSLAALQVFDAAARNTYRAEQSQVVVNQMQAQMEKLRSIPYSQLAMTSNPGTSSNPKDPRSLVSGSNLSVGGTPRPMVINGGSLDGGGTIDCPTSPPCVNPGPVPFTSGDVSGQIYRFVVWVPDPSCSQCSSQSVKRVIVAARIDDAPASYSHSFQMLQTDVSDPDTQVTNNPAPPSNPGNAAAEFWLTDTTCNNSARQPIVSDHASHNTRGVCSDGQKTGSAAGAPDLLFTEAPALDPDYPPAGQPLYDYATDVEPVQNPGQDKGLTLRRPSAPLTGGCLTGTVLNLVDFLGLEPTRETKIHKWVSSPIPTGGNVLMLGHATLSLWTKSINGASHAGGICAYLFIREVSLNLLGVPVYTDVPIANLDAVPQVGYFKYQQTPWPTAWTEISIPMHFINTQLVPGDRIGLAITVDPNATSSSVGGIEFMYDHPSFESRLQLETNTLIGF
jgi:hypothetical protein